MRKTLSISARAYDGRLLTHNFNTMHVVVITAAEYPQKHPQASPHHVTSGSDVSVACAPQRVMCHTQVRERQSFTIPHAPHTQSS